MIIISGLIPDLGNTVEEKKPEILVEFNYDNSLDEIDGAMKTFQMKYTGKRWKVMIVAYSLLCVAALAFVIFNVTNPVSWIAFLICGYGLVYTATDKKRMRVKTIDALKDMNPEDYKATVYSDKIEIDTIIRPKMNEVEMKIDEDADNENIAPIKSTFLFGRDMLDFEENDDSLLLIAARRQIYCFPKRCMTKEQEEALRNIFETKLEIM